MSQSQKRHSLRAPMRASADQTCFSFFRQTVNNKADSRYLHETWSLLRQHLNVPGDKSTAGS